MKITVKNSMLKYLLRPITTIANSSINQSEFLAIAYNFLDFLRDRNNSRLQRTIVFGFVSHWLKNWREMANHLSQQSKLRNYFRKSLESYSRRIFSLSHWVIREPEQGNRQRQRERRPNVSAVISRLFNVI